MNLQRSERDYYVLELATDPPMTGTWEASFDDGTTWVNGTEISTGWAWLVAGPDYDAASVSQNPEDTQATISSTTSPLIRLAEDPVLDVDYGPQITLV